MPRPLAVALLLLAAALPLRAETPEEVRAEALAFRRPYDGPAAEAGSPVVDRMTSQGGAFAGRLR